MKDAEVDPVMHAKLETFKAEHRDLDSAIATMSEQPQCDQLQIQRMKKRKLQLRDMIDQIEDGSMPDISA